MASVTKSNDENAARSDEDEPDAAEGREIEKASKGGKPAKGEREPRGEAKTIEYAKSAGPRRGFFTIYKSGQGYWTRMGTLAGTGVLGLMLAYTLYDKIPAYTGSGAKVGLIVAVAFFAVYAFIAASLMNKPGNVDFLIATDSEMKKVNWTSRKELIGSTKVVVVFMFLIATFLFVVDWLFHLLFYLINVLKIPPPGIPGH